VNYFIEKVERRTRKPWITLEMISKMDGRRKWKNVNNEKGRKDRRLRKLIAKSHRRVQEGIY
jgi:low affinity Fe/Cu permease